ncbi:hypothetical protein PRZ48_000496 [Zasmidium cellare]|uniref:Uncharacterized protein n=1 Tax=Zasmidium cellare TaxID=395010 RepID=A0ABR0EZX0_ZASCE|nr:hypothetical protein PRZ48_000496 [Zasmidium cellare]
MPSASSTSPHPPAAPAPTMPGSGGGASRPPLMKRQSSQSSNQSKHAVISPGSAEPQPLRHHVKKHTKIVLPRNHSSGRNLAKLNRQAQSQAHAEEHRRHGRQRSHEGDTEIRLPGSLDESVRPTTLRRNMTANQLPRNTSHAKLKKNYSHGQLTRLGSGKNLAGLNAAANRAPPSPGLRGKHKRPKSAEMSAAEKDTQEREVRIQQPNQRKGLGKKVGFAVGSAGDASDEEDAPEMEGSGMQEDEWTEESASASPYSTRQNTANNSRRTSVVIDRAAEKLPLGSSASNQDAQAMEQERRARLAREQQHTANLVERGASRPHGVEEIAHQSTAAGKRPINQSQEPTSEPQYEEQQFPQQPVHPKAPQRSPLHAAKEHPNPATRRLLDKSHQLPAPALVSNVSAMDDTHSNRGSPAASMRSSRSNLGDGTSDQHEDELVSRFVPSASHPSMGSGTNTAVGTPKHTGPHTPEDDSTLAGQRRDRNPGFHIGPVSPGSTVSGASSGAATPAIGRSRTELRMLQEKAMADIESQADQKPHLPAHVYDRRNESLKSYLNMAPLGEGRISHTGTTMGPDVFQGRFRALNTELKVVQKFRDPIGEAVARLKGCKGSALNKRSSPQKGQQGPVASGLPSSKSAISLPVHRAQKASDLSKSASPPNGASPLKRGTSTSQVQSQGAERQKQRREVSFRAQPETREFERAVEELPPDVIARQLWESV